MKKLFLLSALVLLMASCAQKEKGAYDVKVSLSGNNIALATDTVMLTTTSRNNPIVDTLVFKDNKVTFTGVVTTPRFMYLLIKTKSDNVYKRACRFFLEEGTTEINLTFDGDTYDCNIKGGEYQTVEDSLGAIGDNMYKAAGLDTLMQKYSTASDEEKKFIRESYDKFQTEMNVVRDSYMESHPLSMYTFQIFINEMENMPIAESKEKLARFAASEKFAGNESLVEAEKVLSIIESLQPGKKAPDFVQNDTEGNPVKFSDIYSKNKVTMVDFWASWCGPCRAFNPTLVKIYKEFHKKGFEVLAVSLDRDKESWLKAIKDDKLTWHHVSDLGYWDNVVAKQFRVRFIPQNLIVNQEGIILGRQVSEEDLVELIKKNL